ncbi:MAG TPA: hypothetical protein VGI52_07760 [Solirubrobacteraceae bacterium]
MRMLIWGIVGLSGLALGIQAIDVHGSINERPAIEQAVRAPLRDLRRRNPRALCEDFTPAVASHLTRAAGDCVAQVRRLFSLAAAEGEYVLTQGPAASQRFAPTDISWHGDRATAATTDIAQPTPAPDLWELELVHGRWRIATPTWLKMRPVCGQRAPGGDHCPGALSMRFAGV